MASMEEALRQNYRNNSGFASAYPQPQRTPWKDFGNNVLDAVKYDPDPNTTWLERSGSNLMGDMNSMITGFDAQGNKIPDTLRMISLLAPGGAGFGGKAAVLGATTGAAPKAGSAYASRLIPDNDRKKYLSNAEQQAISAAENRTFGIPDRQSLIDQANETGNMIAPPWGAKGPKISLEKMISMEDALKIDAPPSGMYQKRNVITPEDIPIGSNLTNLSGDQSGIGVLKNSLSGTSKVDLDGGFGYPQRVGDDIWNSHGPVVNQIQSIADATPDKKTFALTTDMTPIALHFNDMVNKRFFELFDKKAISNADDINETIAKTFKSSKNPDGVTGFPGITSPKFKKWMNKLNGTNRSTVFLALDKGGMQKLGVPDLGEIKHSISSPDSRYRQSSLDPLVGYNAAEIIPGNVGIPNELLDIPHGTYPMGMKGNYPGGFDVKLPRSVVYPQWAEKAAERNLAPAQMQGSFRQNKIIQPVTQQWQDKAMAVREGILKNK